MKKFAILLSMLALPLVLGAQNLNPEVQVTNEYETRIADVVKQGPAMTIPDSMLRFDYHFDYSVFESPYKGAYEFYPYSVTITPAAGGYDGRKLWLSAGAGWTFKPELDFVWSALDRKNAAVNVFAKGDGFWGNYLNVSQDSFFADRSRKHTGWDFRTVAGVDTRFNIGKSVLRSELAYDGIFTGHYLPGGGISHAPYASLRIGKDSESGLSYTVGASYRYVNETLEGKAAMQDHEVKADFFVSPYLGDGTRGYLEMQFAYNRWYLGLEARPHARFSIGKFDFDAGLRAGGYTDKLGVRADVYGFRFTISPDVTVEWHLLNKHLNIIAGAVGQNHMQSYWDYKTVCHWYNYDYADPQPVWEIADLYAGVNGFTGFGLRGELKAGYKFLNNVPLWTVSSSGREYLTYNNCSLLHVDLELAWKNERFDVQSSAHYNWLPEGVNNKVFAPAALRADFSASYNWMKRVYVGVFGDMSTSRTAIVNVKTITLPWYMNLGVRAEYKFRNGLGVWIKGDNLLNHIIRTSPIHCPYGPSATAGITLSL